MGFEFLIPIFAIVFGTVLTGVIFYGIVSLIKTWISRNNSSYDEEKFDRLAKAFIQHKKETARRLQHIESLIDEDKLNASAANQAPGKSISSRDIEVRGDMNKETNESARKLSNMLDRKRDKS